MPGDLSLGSALSALSTIAKTSGDLLASHARAAYALWSASRPTPQQRAYKMKRASRQDSPLLRISPEIRNAVYELVFSRMYIQIPEWHGIDYHGSNPIPLLLTCKKIHAEAIQLYYASAIFHFKYDSIDCFEKWTKGIGPVRTALIKHVWLQRDHEFPNNRCDSDDAVREDAEEAQELLDDVQQEFGLSPGVLSVDLNFGDYGTWTKSPVETAENILRYTTFVEASGQFWLSNPSRSMRRKMSGVHTL